jgi:ParB family transcriptional regulator, chromosome partitioning protein
MDEIVTILLSEIFVPEDRLRQVKEDYAQLFASKLKAGRTLQPIKVRRTPNGAAPYTLVYGAHRMRAHQLAGLADITAMVATKGDKLEAREEEIEENLFRNELSALERIDTVAEYKRLFVAKHGELKRGNPEFANSAKLAELNLLGVNEDSNEGLFFQRVAERLGLSRRSTERLSTIASRLQPVLHKAITGTEIEDNQSAIERLSRLDPAMQENYAKVLKDNGGNLALADEALDPKARLTRDEAAYEGLADGWTRTNAKVRVRFVKDYLPAIAQALASDQAALATFCALNRAALEEALAALPAPDPAPDNELPTEE